MAVEMSESNVENMSIGELEIVIQKKKQAEKEQSRRLKAQEQLENLSLTDYQDAIVNAGSLDDLVRISAGFVQKVRNLRRRAFPEQKGKQGRPKQS